MRSWRNFSRSIYCNNYPHILGMCLSDHREHETRDLGTRSVSIPGFLVRAIKVYKIPVKVR